MSSNKRTCNGSGSKNGRRKMPKIRSIQEMMRASSPVHAIKECTNCNATDTSLWHDGPAGPKSLCHRCFMRIRKQKLNELIAARKIQNDNEAAATLLLLSKSR
ncbi:hypothetical protein IFM89_014271 [Coptis chinensis]|uniref:GATA-type domain-containing protein n=1 Tax=Coptis chinensis TaxID=261450 RepID=A0A835LF31_9MAGN|nr:hypothetical protein IFM89_014271 [Coptis chinensis]